MSQTRKRQFKPCPKCGKQMGDVYSRQCRTCYEDGRYPGKSRYKRLRERVLILDQHRCAICNQKPKRLCIDHDHRCSECGKDHNKALRHGLCIRGVLCSRCNHAVGHFETPGLFEKINDYLHRLPRDPEISTTNWLMWRRTRRYQ